MGKLNNRFIRAVLPAILLHISIGSVYCWSLFVTPISEYIGKSTQSVQFAFSLAIFFLGLSAAFGGKFVENNIKRSGTLSLLCFCSGLLITGLAIHLKSLPILYVGYGVIGGIGLGIGYLTPVKNLLLWFPNNKGLATGIAIMSFGFASMVGSPLITLLSSHVSLPMTFVLLGLIYSAPMFISILLIKRPNDYIASVDKSDFKLLSMFKNKTFIAIWFMVYINISCGLALISVASPIMKEISLSVSIITLIIAIMGIFNGAGRLVFSTLSDKLKDRNNIYKVIFGLSIIAILSTIICNNIIIIALLVISACYGAGFSNLPSLLSDKFGMDNISKIHGLSLTAWALAGLTGNQISTLIKNMSGSYFNVLWVLIACYTVGLIICVRLSNKIEG